LPLQARRNERDRRTGFSGIAVASRSLHACATVAEVPQSKRRATYEDLMQVPDTKIAEIIDGELIVSPRPASPHALAGSSLQTLIGAPFHQGIGGPGGWWILMEPELHLGSDVVVPDLSGWRRARMPEYPSAPWFSLVPDWVCEVASPSTERFDRVDKLPVYAHAGVGHVWLVNPITRTIEIYRREGAAWTLVGAHGGDAIVRAEPFEAIELELGRLWDAPRPQP
jgi:Uma2 family endonuclease